MSEPGPLLGRGRMSDVFDLGDGTVLRRYRRPLPGRVEREAGVMHFLAAQGIPVPKVHRAGGGDMVMERIEGSSLLDEVRRRPWRARAIGAQLGRLHGDLHAIVADPTLDLPRRGDGDRVLHLDFHPDNVLFRGTEPVIIDWTNAAVGSPGADVATSWVVMATSQPPNLPAFLRPLLALMRRQLVRGYLSAVPRPDAVTLRDACERRLDDPNCRPEEAVLVRRLQSNANHLT